MKSGDKVILSSIPFENLMAELENRITVVIDNRLSAILNAPKRKESKDDYITRKEAARILGISLVTLDKWSYKQSILKAYRISSRVRYKRSEVESCLHLVRTWKHSRQNAEGGGYV